MIDELTPVQEAMIPSYRQKWRTIALQTQPIDRQQTIKAVESAYHSMGKPAPEVLFFTSPYGVLSLLNNQISAAQLARRLGAPLQSLAERLYTQLEPQIAPELWQDLIQQLSDPELQQIWQQQFLQLAEQVENHPGFDGLFLLQFQEQIQQQVLEQFWREQENNLRAEVSRQPGGDWLLHIGDTVRSNWVEPIWKQLDEGVWQPLMQQTFLGEAVKPLVEDWQQFVVYPFTQFLGGVSLLFRVVQLLGFGSIYREALIEFCVSELGCTHHEQQWQALQTLSQSCGWILMFERACLVCDRPIRLTLNDQMQLHAEGDAALQFADGFRLYAYRGVRIPERYGLLHPHQWRSQWLLQEPNAELRRVLIQGIGYGRICQELGAIELDSWREYTLLRIAQDIDVEPIHLLKMICPSTGYIHVTRVPPEIITAREAIRWVNWGTDPQEFAVET